MKIRIAITGVGVVSSAGIGKEAFWNSLLNGVPKNGFLIEDFDPLPFFDGNAKEALLVGLTDSSSLLLLQLKKLSIRLVTL